MSTGSKRLGRGQRLTASDDFQAVFRQGNRIERGSVTAVWKRGAAGGRVGFTVSRQIRGAATRNRARRRVREAYRTADRPRLETVDLVLVARAPALRNPFSNLSRDVASALAAIAARTRDSERA